MSRTLDDFLERGVPNAFLDSPLYREISDLLDGVRDSIPVPEGSFAGPWLALAWSVSSGNVCILSIRDDEFPGSDLIEITDEKLLEKLRSVNGQFTCSGRPVFYYDHLMSTANGKVWAKTGKVPKWATKEGRHIASSDLWKKFPR
jgi:hypothetical protein